MCHDFCDEKLQSTGHRFGIKKNSHMTEHSKHPHIML